jgi:hypothetical protein
MPMISVTFIEKSCLMIAILELESHIFAFTAAETLSKQGYNLISPHISSVISREPEDQALLEREKIAIQKDV